MNIPIWVRWALGLTLLLGASSRLKLPMPTSLLDPLIAEVAPGFELRHGRQWLRWGTGELVIEDLEIDYLGERRARVKRVDVGLDLWPWSPDFGVPTQIAVQQPDADVDREFLDALAEVANRLAPEDGAESRMPPWLQIQVRNMALRAVDDAQRRWSTSGIHADLHIDANLGGQLRVSGDTLSPLPGKLTLLARSNRGLRDWRGSLRCDVELRSNWAQLNPEGWSWTDGKLGLLTTFQASPEGLQGLQARVEVDVATIDGDAPLVAVHDFHFSAQGDLEQGFRFESRAVEEHGELLFHGELRAPEEDWTDLSAWGLRAFIDAPESRANPENIAWLSDLAPPITQDIAEALSSLGLNGTGEMHAFVGYHPADAWTWALHVLPLDLELSYRGFVDEEGQRIAAPYPLVEPEGIYLVGGNTMLWDARARAGTASVHCDGTVSFPDPLDPLNFDVHVAVSVRGLTLDRQAAHALSGNPELAARWRELGSPLGGTLDLEFEVFQSDRVTDAWVSGRAMGLSGSPRALPVQTSVEDLRFDWRDDRAEFRGRIAALGGRAQVSGKVHEPVDGSVPSIELHVTGAAFRPSQQERLALQGYLRLPDDLREFQLVGDLGYRASMRSFGDAQAHLLAQVDLGGSDLRDHARELALERMQGAGQLSWGAGGLGLLFPAMDVQVPGGVARASVTVYPEASVGRATFGTDRVDLDEEFTDHLRRIVGLYLFEDSVGFSGRVSMRGTMNPLAPADFRGVLHCEPVLISAVDDEQREVYALEGDLRVSLDRLRADRLRLYDDRTELWASGLDLRRGEDSSTVLDVQLDSSSGLRLDSNLRQLLTKQARDTLHLVGVQGLVYPRQLAVHLEQTENGYRVDFDGDLELREFQLEAAGGVTGGNARLALDGTWSGMDDYSAELTLREARATISGLAVADGTAAIHLNPEALRMDDFRASMLGGTVSSNTRDATGRPQQGEIRLGLNGEAPFRAHLGFRGMQMGRMREELAIGGSLAGTVDADIDLHGQAMQTNSLGGRGRISIREGILGTVPVLKQIWAVAGVNPPTFDQGTLDFRANGADRFIIDNFRLDHSLMAVQGKGFVRFDSALHLKVTVRTLGAFGDLPIFRDVLDWFVEQDVRGPVERPVIYQRSASKIFNTEPFVPFPLWVPPGERPNWRNSPVTPVVAAPQP